MKSNKSKGLRFKIMMAAVVPAVITFAVILSVAFVVVKNSISNEVKKELSNICAIFDNLMDNEYPGEYKKVGQEKIAIYKGEALLNDDYKVVDMISNETDVEVTFFYGDLRVLTTIRNTSGERIVGTVAPVRVREDVLENGQTKFYDNVDLNGESFYGYYKPVKSNAGETIGIIFAGKSAKEVNSYIRMKLIPIVIVCILGMILVAYISIMQTNKIVDAIHKVQKLFKDVSNGKLNGSVDSSILKRNDEISDMGHSVVTMQSALREMVEKDALTQINNRRFGENKLKETIGKAKISGMPFSISIGDIDYFKKVNDTYGHDCGDAVLVTVAAILKKSMAGKGFVARWGGEEFLLVFDRLNYNDSVAALNMALEEIRATVVNTKEYDISVTMSFGITEGNTEEETRIMLKRADELLYTAKTSGRNQVMSDNINSEEGQEDVN